MKSAGGILAWLGSMAMLIGSFFFLLSFKNGGADLSEWSLVGFFIGGIGLTLALVGAGIYFAAPKPVQTPRREIK